MSCGKDVDGPGIGFAIRGAIVISADGP